MQHLDSLDFARGADGTQVLLSNNDRSPQHFFYHTLLKVDLSNYGYARHFKFLKQSKILLTQIASYLVKADTSTMATPRRRSPIGN
ncbi:hypothetical protein [Anabaena sp. AL93]|uniref:hypothetical protein n=1 Tax=Anabaena sp. AL93 TaxID=1678133 RepID=UPI000A5E9FCC|nr:hypothetical protein [Anabaena sp. AL93]